MNHKFKTGDILELVNNKDDYGDMSAEIGAKAILTERGYFMTDDDGIEYIDVKWIDKKANDQSDGGYYESDFRLYKKKKLKDMDINEKSYYKMTHK